MLEELKTGTPNASLRHFFM